MDAAAERVHRTRNPSAKQRQNGELDFFTVVRMTLTPFRQRRNLHANLQSKLTPNRIVTTLLSCRRSGRQRVERSVASQCMLIHLTLFVDFVADCCAGAALCHQAENFHRTVCCSSSAASSSGKDTCHIAGFKLSVIFHDDTYSLSHSFNRKSNTSERSSPLPTPTSWQGEHPAPSASLRSAHSLRQRHH